MILKLSKHDEDENQIKLEDVGKRIYNTRTDRDMKQESLAQKTGIPKSTISKIENNHQAASLSQLEKISKAMNVRVEYLLGLDNDIDDEHHGIRVVIDMLRSPSCLLTTEKAFHRGLFNLEPQNAVYDWLECCPVLTIRSSLFELLKKIAQIGDFQAKHPDRKNECTQMYKDAIDNYFLKKSNKASQHVVNEYLLVTKEQLDKVIKEQVRYQIAVNFAVDSTGETEAAENKGNGD